jgi:hypothetical protein
MVYFNSTRTQEDFTIGINSKNDNRDYGPKKREGYLVTKGPQENSNINGPTHSLCDCGRICFAILEWIVYSNSTITQEDSTIGIFSKNDYRDNGPKKREGYTLLIFFPQK